MAMTGAALAGGPAVVLDGDTLRIGGEVLGLYGIAAPGRAQTCETVSGERRPCGLESARALARHIGAAELACEPRGLDRHHRKVVLCRIGGEDLAGWLVENGHAVADRLSATVYVAAETSAWARRRGLWSMAFEEPSERRREDFSAPTLVSALAP